MVIDPSVVRPAPRALCATGELCNRYAIGGPQPYATRNLYRVNALERRHCLNDAAIATRDLAAHAVGLRTVSRP